MCQTHNRDAAKRHASLPRPRHYDPPATGEVQPAGERSPPDVAAA